MKITLKDGSVMELANGMAVIDIAKEISEEFDVDPRRSASLLDMFTSVGQGIIPYGAQLLSAATLTGLTPLQIIPNLYYPLLMGVCGVLAIIFRPQSKKLQ